MILYTQAVALRSTRCQPGAATLLQSMYSRTPTPASWNREYRGIYWNNHHHLLHATQRVNGAYGRRLVYLGEH